MRFATRRQKPHKRWGSLCRSGAAGGCAFPRCTGPCGSPLRTTRHALKYQHPIEAAAPTLVPHNPQRESFAEGLEPSIEMSAKKDGHVGQQPSPRAQPTRRREMVEDGDAAAGLQDSRGLPQ